MTTMTVEQAIERADLYRDEEDADSVMGRVLADALREAQARCVRLSETNHAMFAAVLPGKAMRDDKVGQVKWAVSEFERRIAEAQAAVVQMREDAAKIADGVLDGPLPAGAFAIAVRISKAIRSLPAPAARTYDDGVRAALNAVRGVSVEGFLGSPDGVAALMQDRCEKAVAERMPYSPAPAVAPVAAQDHGTVTGSGHPRAKPTPDAPAFDPDDAHRFPFGPAPVAAPKPGPTKIVNEVGRAPFDAEAALVAMEQSIARRQHGPTPATRYEVYTAIQDALAAGRGGGR